MFSSITAFSCLAAFASRVSADTASDLAAALADFPALSNLKSLVDQRLSVVNDVLSGHQDVTLLAPSDDALAAYASANGHSLSELPSAGLNNVLSYHVLGAGLTSANFSAVRGITIPTLLQGELYNNRSAGADLIQAFGANAKGQVVYVQGQDKKDGVFSLQAGGTSSGVNLTALNKVWRGGYIHVVDQVLGLPKNCTETMEDESSLKTLSESLEHTDVYHPIDWASNVTCLAPSNAAFEAAGNLQERLNRSDLNALVLSHVLPQPLYPDHIRDGMELQSMGNTTVKVTLKGTDMYFNDAKVVKSALLTNNGLVYVLDKVLPSEHSLSTTSSTAPSSSPTSSMADGAATVNACFVALAVLASFSAAWA